jgi:hypothetical protein
VGHDTRHDPGTRTSSPRRVRDSFPTPCKHTSWRPAREAGPDRSLNAGLLSCTAVSSPSSPTLPHASFTCGTQAPPTTSSGLRPRFNMAVYSSTQAGLDTNGLLGRGAKPPWMNSTAQPRGSSHDIALLQCVLTDSDTRRDVPATKHCDSYFLSHCTPPLESIKGRKGQLLEGLDIPQTEHSFQGNWVRHPLSTSL